MTSNTTGSDDSDVPIAVSVTVQSIKTSRSAISRYGKSPKHNYVGLLVIYSCTRGPCSYNPYDFFVRDAGGNEYQAALDSFKPDLQSGDLRTGRKARGYITYDLPKGKYLFEYRVNSFDKNGAAWNLAVT